MSLEDDLLREHSKNMADRLGEKALDEAETFEGLMSIYLSGTKKLSQRAAYPLTKVCDQNPRLFQGYVNNLIDVISKPEHPAVIRHGYRTLRYLDIPAYRKSDLYNRCLEDLNRKKTPIAIKALAMELAANICSEYPELGIELKTIIELQMDDASTGFRSAGIRVLRRLQVYDER